MSESNASLPIEKRGSLTLLLLILLVPVLVVLGLIYVLQVYKPVQDKKDSSAALMEKMTGIASPIIGGNHLAKEFTDTNGDLVADAPTDAAKLIDPETLVFSFIAQDDPARTRDAWKPFTDHLSKVTGKAVEYELSEAPVDQIRALHDGKLHVTGFNSGNVPTAVDVAGFVPVVVVPGGDGAGMTCSLFIVPAGSAIKTLDEVRGKNMTFTSPGSNSGFKAPMLTLMEKSDLRPERDYSIIYSQSHENSIVGVKKKEVVVAAVASDMMHRAIVAGTITKDDYRVLYESEKFPSASIGYAHNLKPELAAKIREAITTFDWKGTSLELELTAAPQTKFLPADYKNDFALLRKIDEVTGTKHELK